MDTARGNAGETWAPQSPSGQKRREQRGCCLGTSTVLLEITGGAGGGLKKG